jgi:CelD/BcsL family acetyltransferase involved in cellulose biosynthesis
MHRVETPFSAAQRPRKCHPLGEHSPQGTKAVNSLRTIHLASVADLRASASAWDDLWQRSEVSLPLVRAELLAQWVEHFCRHSDFHALVIADQSRWVAALPLVPCRVGWLIPAAGLPCNPWAPCGDLLCDPAAVDGGAMDMLLAAATALPWHLLWFNDAEIETPRWQAFTGACDRAGIAAHCHEQCRVGRIEIGGDWDAYQKQLAKNHRQAMNRAAKRLGCGGNLQFEAFSKLEPAKVEPWLREAFEVEDLGWKGQSGTSVLQTPGMFSFFLRQAEQLARWGQLEVASLRVNGRMIAYVYGFRAKGVCFAHKISYDPQYASFSPGQFLFYRMLERFYAEGETRTFDLMGPLTQSHLRWRPSTYGVGRVALAPRRLLGRAAMVAYKGVWRRFREWQTGEGDQVAVPTCCGRNASESLDAAD